MTEVIDSTNEASVLCSDEIQIKELQEGVKALKILENEAWTEIWRRVR
ncbi:hypothetical protein MTBSS4_660005 [Magnetospirillum sp. SS-4]|nr:hypothetical protein MTBSS4_660005 [Magnetospirillum sp. SS-4]